jgi:hypothetical protein
MQQTRSGGTLVRLSVCAAAAALVLALQAAPAVAQGSTGGSIGKQDKSISGGQDGGAVRSAPRERSAPKRSGGGGGGNFDGTWASASAGQTCSDRTTDVVTISGGRMTGTGFNGRVSGSGSVSGLWAGSGITASVSGRMSGNSGSGTFRRSDGCVGTWTLRRQ